MKKENSKQVKQMIEEDEPPNLGEKNGKNNRIHNLFYARDNRRYTCYSLLPIRWQAPGCPCISLDNSYNSA